MHAYLEEFARECSQQKPADTDEKFVGWEGLIVTLVGFGLAAALPELREWARLGAAASAVLRQKLTRKLVDYASEHELDFPAAEKAAEVVAQRVNEDNVGVLLEALESDGE